MECTGCDLEHYDGIHAEDLVGGLLRRGDPSSFGGETLIADVWAALVARGQV